MSTPAPATPAPVDQRDDDSDQLDNLAAAAAAAAPKLTDPERDHLRLIFTGTPR